MSRKSKKEQEQWDRDMDWVLEHSGWPLLMCKCGRTIGRYPPNDHRIKRTQCLTCLIRKVPE